MEKLNQVMLYVLMMLTKRKHLGPETLEFVVVN